MGTEIVEVKIDSPSFKKAWDLYRDGRYICSDACEEMARLNQTDFEKEKWAFLDCTHRGMSPLQVLERIAAEGWALDDIGFRQGMDGRAHLSGYVAAWPLVFKFLILNQDLIGQVRETLSGKLAAMTCHVEVMPPARPVMRPTSASPVPPAPPAARVRGSPAVAVQLTLI